GRGSGGGINNYGTLTVSDSTFTSNSASVTGAFGGGSGGGIYNVGTLTVSNSTFTSNSAPGTYGGGGGGIDNVAPPTVSNSTPTSTSAGGGCGSGGGITNYGTLTVSNSTFTGNSATGTSGRGGGIANYTSGTLTVSNTIVAGNTAPNGPDIYGTVQTQSSYNLIGIGGGLTGLSDGVNGNHVGTPASPLDPRLAPLADYGGPTQTMALLADSPALVAGGASTRLTSAVDATATTLEVDFAAGLAVTPGLTIL